MSRTFRWTIALILIVETLAASGLLWTMLLLPGQKWVMTAALASVVALAGVAASAIWGER